MRGEELPGKDKPPYPCPWSVVVAKTGQRVFCDMNRGHGGTHVGNRSEADYRRLVAQARGRS